MHRDHGDQARSPSALTHSPRQARLTGNVILGRQEQRKAPCQALRHFIKDGSAATAIEYGLIAALIAAVTVLAITAAGERVRDLFQGIGSPIAALFPSGGDGAWREVASSDFSSGPGGWECQGPSCPEELRVEEFGDWGWMIGPHGRDLWPNSWLSFPVTLSEGATAALIEFDLFIIDSWDGVGTRFSRGGNAGQEGDAVRMRIDDTTFSVQQFIHSDNPALLGGEPGNLFDPSRVDHNMSLRGPVRSASGTIGDSAFTMNMTLVDSGNEPSRTHSLTRSSEWEDQRWRVQLEIENPQQDFTFRMMPTVAQTLDDEAMGISNFSVRER